MIQVCVKAAHGKYLTEEQLIETQKICDLATSELGRPSKFPRSNALIKSFDKPIFCSHRNRSSSQTLAIIIDLKQMVKQHLLPKQKSIEATSTYFANNRRKHCKQSIYPVAKLTENSLQKTGSKRNISLCFLKISKLKTVSKSSIDGVNEVELQKYMLNLSISMRFNMCQFLQSLDDPPLKGPLT